MLTTAKVRPANGTGPNGLRGGRNNYSSKTAVGPWLESVGGPSGYIRGFSTSAFQTEAQSQQLGVVKKAPPLYGAGLPRAVDLRSPTTADTMDCNFKTSQWKTSTQAMLEQGVPIVSPLNSSVHFKLTN